MDNAEAKHGESADGQANQVLHHITVISCSCSVYSRRPEARIGVPQEYYRNSCGANSFPQARHWFG
jgi:hypothetical protein